MDDMVLQAMAKWPNVPHCYGWLGLDARGNWYMRDDASQAAGSFASGNKGAKGSLLQHEKLIDFIQRNYDVDSVGQWFFQNGPQRVYVELEATPWVWRVDADFAIHSHCGLTATFQAAYLDETGWLYLKTSLGFGLVHTQDMGYAANAVEQSFWTPEAVTRTDLPSRFRYICSPLRLQKKPTE